MMSEDYMPLLLEVNSSPGMLPSSVEKAKLCGGVIEDTIKGIKLQDISSHTIMTKNLLSIDVISWTIY